MNGDKNCPPMWFCCILLSTQSPPEGGLEGAAGVGEEYEATYNNIQISVLLLTQRDRQSQGRGNTPPAIKVLPPWPPHLSRLSAPKVTENRRRNTK